MPENYFKIKNWCKDNKYFLAVMLLAVFLLLYRVAARAFWGDEKAVLEYLNNSVSGFLVAYWKLPDNHPPLYYFLVLLLSKILPWTELAIRLVSILAGLGIVWLVYIFTFRVTRDKRIALLTAFFTVFSSYFVLISQMARYHSLAAFSSLLVFYFFYQLFVEGYNERVWRRYLATMVLVGYVDYPHFIYVVLFTNFLYFYRFFRRRTMAPVKRWLVGQFFVAVLVMPAVIMLLNRIFIQGDGGFSKTNLLANSWISIVAGILFHIYSFFFGENIFPWNYIIFSIGLVVLFAIAVGLVQALRKKLWGIPQAFILLLSAALIVVNTFFLNIANPRYNFIVYPKFVFVAYPLLVMSFVLCISSFRSKKVQTVFILFWAMVELAGLTHFYQRNNYINPSYFSDFKGYEFVRDNSKVGDYFVINVDISIGTYNFYKDKYFSKVTPVPPGGLSELLDSKRELRVWFFSVGSDGDSDYGSVTATDQIPDGFKIADQFQSVPVDPILLKLKQKITGRQSYVYKYGVYLLTNE
ncbi:MAG: Glycosyl transferase family 39 [Candidatus Magasanikbacteria bacterium GW2011_GWA2_40_10]|uniref:Glycosyl transferase family 39 n=1 Tax=Candidatus Magasanikbacteria bacterium GW2011_GWA2_40_10 TaxID=1619037 RepID=A0A0G0T9G5_9BACT|nr:MAG: Glycosyl transferase family 39 [Candidatus Magasanikbacteria bacterium GW2011_GWA2_40_10]